jgi:hypothetical protein
MTTAACDSGGGRKTQGEWGDTAIPLRCPAAPPQWKFARPPVLPRRSAPEVSLVRPLLLATALLALGAPALAGQPPDYQAVDQYALQATADDEKSLAALAKYLSKAGPTPKEKARAAFRWVADRIAYDTDAYYSGQPLPRPTPESVLKTRKAVCDGYCVLTVELCRRMDIPVAHVIGYSFTHDYKQGTPFKDVNHGWVAVQLGKDKKWELIDPTFGAGYIQGKQFVKQFQGYFFLTPAEEFAFSHLPVDAKWQLVKPALTLKDFEKQGPVPWRLFEFGATVQAVRQELASKNYQGFVQIATIPGKRVRGMEFPVGKYLQGGKDYALKFQTSDFTEMVIIQGEQAVELKKDGDVFAGTMRPQRGDVIIGARAAGMEAYEIVLKYAVE